MVLSVVVAVVVETFIIVVAVAVRVFSVVVAIGVLADANAAAVVCGAFLVVFTAVVWLYSVVVVVMIDLFLVVAAAIAVVLTLVIFEGEVGNDNGAATAVVSDSKNNHKNYTISKTFDTEKFKRMPIHFLYFSIKL